MKRALKVFLLLLIIPTISYLILTYAHKTMDETLRNAILESIPAGESVSQEQIKAVTAFDFCNDKEVIDGPSPFCRDYNILRLARLCAIIIPVTVLLFISLIICLGRKARRDRTVLLKYFKPALYLTALFTILLIAATVAVLLAAVYYGEIVIFNAFTPKLLLLVLIAGLIGLYMIIKSIWQGLRRPYTSTLAVKLTKEEQPQVWNMVKDIAYRLNAPEPDNIIAGLEDTFYVTEIDTRLKNETLTGQTLYISLPLSRILSKEELKSIIGHELSHFAGDDVKFTTNFYPIYTSASNAISSMDAASDDNIVFKAALFPAITIFFFFISEFSVLEAEISRERELIADKTSADLISGVMPMATGLIKAHAYGPVFEEVYAEMEKMLRGGNPQKNMSFLYEKITRETPSYNAINNMGIEIETHPSDTHPILQDRLANIGISLEAATSAGLTIPAKEDSAISLIHNYEELEEAQTAVQNEFAASALQEILKTNNK